jgi:hypothetical protein
MVLVRALPQHMQQGFLNQIFRELLIAASETIKIAEQWGVMTGRQRS